MAQTKSQIVYFLEATVISHGTLNVKIQQQFFERAARCKLLTTIVLYIAY